MKKQLSVHVLRQITASHCVRREWGGKEERKMCNNLTKIKIKLTEMQQFLKFRIIVNKKMKLKSYSDLKKH